MSDTAIRYARLDGAHGSLVLSNRESGQKSRFWLTGLDGWFGGVGVSGEQSQRGLGHGLFLKPAKRTGRVLTLRGTLIFPDDPTRLVADRFLSGILWDGEYGTLTVLTDSLELMCEVRLDGDIKHTYKGLQSVEIQIPLVAADPFLYGPPQRFQIYPAGAGTGLMYPLFTTKKAVDGTPVLDWGAGTPVGGSGINEGNATAYPTITVRGDWPAGFSIASNGKRLTYAAPVHNSTPVVVDCKTGSVLTGDMDKTYQLTERSWFAVDPESTFQPTIRAIAPSSGWADVEISSTYI